MLPKFNLKKDFSEENQELLLRVRTKIQDLRRLIDKYDKAALKQRVNDCDATVLDSEDNDFIGVAIAVLLITDPENRAVEFLRSRLKEAIRLQLKIAGAPIETALLGHALATLATAEKIEQFERHTADENGLEFVPSETVSNLKKSAKIWREKAAHWGEWDDPIDVNAGLIFSITD